MCWRAAGMLAVVVLTLAACGSGASLGDAPQPRDGRAGLQVSGQLNGAQVALSDGSPRLVVGDCDPSDGRDDDVCAIASDINGELFVFAIENPDVLESGTTIPIGDPGCAPEACDDVDDVAVVDVQTGVGRRLRAVGGRLEVRQLEPFLRYAGTAQVRLPRGELAVQFDLVPQRDE